MQLSEPALTRLPQSIQEVEALVSLLYQPGVPSHDLVAIQNRLHELQLSDLGWKIGDGLLASSDSNVRFFGALTFTIKLNSVGSSLDAQSAEVLEATLLRWIANLSAGDDHRVQRKLATTLAVFYLVDLELMGKSVCRLLWAVLHSGDARPPEHFAIQPSPAMDLSTLTPRCFTIVLWYINALAEEAGKNMSSSSSEKFVRLIEQYNKAIPDIICLIEHALKGPNFNADYVGGPSVAMPALSSTIFFYLNYCTTKQEIIDRLKGCLNLAIAYCQSSLDLEAITQLTELLSSGSRIFGPEQYLSVSELIRSPWGISNLNRLIEVPIIDEQPFVSLILEYTDAQIVTLLEQSVDPEKGAAARTILDMMHSLLSCKGCPELEDEVAPRVLEFWNNFVEYVDDIVSEDGAANVVDFAKQVIMRMVQQLLVKVQIPPDEVWDDVDDDEKKAFRDFRTDAKDLLQSSYRVLGTLMADYIAARLHTSAEVNWYKFEGSLFCLGAISSGENEGLDRILEPVFGPSLISRLGGSGGIPTRTVRTVVNLMAQSTGFFKRHPQYLATSLNFLFATLQASPSPDDSARAISALCSHCRRDLTSEISTFLHKYEEFIYQPGVTDFAAEKLASAIGYLLQALPKLGDTISGANIVLEHVSQGLTRTVSLAMAGDMMNAAAVGSISVHCLSSLAESLRRPADDTTDLYDENPAIPSAEEIVALKEFQAKVFSTVAKALEILRDNGEIISEICSVFKAGFTESQFSLFHFAPDIIVQFFSITHAKTANLEAVLRMACAFLRSQAREGVPDAADDSVGKLLLHLSGLITELRDPREDSDIASNLIEVLKSFIPSFLPILLKLQPVSQIETILEFTIKALEIPEPLPKRAAIQFWDALMDVTSEEALVDQGLLDEVIERYGPGFCMAFARQLSGGATRLDLDFFASPARKLLKRSVHAKKWIEEALNREVPQDKVSLETRQRFVHQLGLVRNQRGAREVLRVFWSECHGMTSGYAPIR